MTVQVMDEFDYFNNDYSIISVENNFLFDPNDYGFTPVFLNTACYRGFFCKFSLENDCLILTQMSIGLDNANPPVWRGIKALGEREFEYWTYNGITLPIDYTGGIIIGRYAIKEFLNIFGFCQPHSTKHVIELIFDKGNLIRAINHDKYMEKARKAICAASQIYKKSIGYFEETESVSIKLPDEIDIKSYTLLVKEIASKYISSTSIELLNNFRSKGCIELDKKIHFGEYRELTSCFEKKGYKNVVFTKYSNATNPQLDSDEIIAQNSELCQLLELYNKYKIGEIFLL